MQLLPHMWLLVAAQVCTHSNWDNATGTYMTKFHSVCAYSSKATPVDPSQAYGIFVSFNMCDGAMRELNATQGEPKVRCIFYQGRLP